MVLSWLVLIFTLAEAIAAPLVLNFIHQILTDKDDGLSASRAPNSNLSGVRGLETFQ
jgi:hypothetical protein